MIRATLKLWPFVIWCVVTPFDRRVFSFLSRPPPVILRFPYGRNGFVSSKRSCLLRTDLTFSVKAMAAFKMAARRFSPFPRLLLASGFLSKMSFLSSVN